MKIPVLVIGILVLIGAGVFIYSRSQVVETKNQKTIIPESSSVPEPTISLLSSTPVPTKGENTMNEQKKQFSSAPKRVIDEKKHYIATLTTTKGKIKINLYPSDAPNTVNNFVFLAKEGFYNDTPFHRILKGFMIQGGDPTGTGMGGPGYQFEDEPVMKSYTRGTIAMANAGPDTNGSQFFIMHADYGLPKNYTIFGAIDSGDQESLASLDAIATTPVAMSSSGEPSKPTEKVLVNSVSIEEK